LGDRDQLLDALNTFLLGAEQLPLSGPAWPTLTYHRPEMAPEDAGRPFLTDAELILGLARHLGIYTVGRPHAELANLEFAGRVYEMAWRLRGSGLSSIGRVGAIGLEAGIPTRQLSNEVLPALETLGWIEIQRDSDGTALRVDERIPPPADLLRLSDSVVAISAPSRTERAALVVLRETSRLPLTLEAAIDLASAETNEEAARSAIDVLGAVQLVRRSGRTMAAMSSSTRSYGRETPNSREPR
jgi:hypothetical protein